MKKHFLLITLFGFTSFLLKTKAIEAQIRSTYYQFQVPGACYELGKDGSWLESNVCSDESIESYEISDALNSFCLYEVKGDESLNIITKKLGFLRPVERVKLSLTNSGSIMTSKFIRAGAKLLFYNGDILRAEDKSLCRKPTKIDIKSSFYALSYPATFYVMRPFLKKTGASLIKEPLLKKIESGEEDSINELRAIINRKKNKKPINDENYKDLDFEDEGSDLKIGVGFFFEEFNGTQKSNGSQAKILNELSPSIKIIYTPSAYNLNFSLTADLHIFDENIGQLQILDEQVINFSLQVSSNFKLLNFLSLQTYIGVGEDLFYKRQSASNIGFEKDLITRFGLGLNINLIQTSSLTLGFVPQFFYDLEGEVYEAGLTYKTPILVSLQNEGFSLNVELGYTNRDKELADLELDYSKYFLELSLGIEI